MSGPARPIVMVVAYHRTDRRQRRTIRRNIEQLDADERFEVHKVNVALRRWYRPLAALRPDVLLLHYTVLATRWGRSSLPESTERRIGRLRALVTWCAAAPQDEYANHRALAAITTA